MDGKDSQNSIPNIREKVKNSKAEEVIFVSNLENMSKKHKGRPDGLVYSTNHDYYNDYSEENNGNTLPAKEQRLRVKLDTKQRAGKVVTLIEGFEGTNEDLEALGKQVKTKCGTGGSVKDGLIIIQGDYKEKIIAWLKDWGYSLTKG